MRRSRVFGWAMLVLMLAVCFSGLSNDAVATEYGVILIDRSGSMTVIRHTGNSRFDDAIMAARLDVQGGFPPVDEWAVITFNGDDDLVLHQWFTPDKDLVDAALLAIPPAIVGPRTPLADAMCNATEVLKNMTGGRWLMGYTDGDENDSDGLEVNVCDVCDYLYPTGWLDFCDPSDNDPPCTDLQMCVFNSLVGEAVNTWRYFGNPIVKSGGGMELEKGVAPGNDKDIQDSEDYTFLKQLSDSSGGELVILPDDSASIVDFDFDGVDDLVDNCPTAYNPDQLDLDAI